MSSKPPHTYSSAKVIQRRRRASSKSAHLYARALVLEAPASQNAALSSTSSSSTMPTAITPWWFSNWEITAGTAAAPAPTVRVSGSSGTSPRSPPKPPTKPRPASACAADARKEPVEMSPRPRKARGGSRPSPRRGAGGRAGTRAQTRAAADATSPRTPQPGRCPAPRRPRAVRVGTRKNLSRSRKSHRRRLRQFEVSRFFAANTDRRNTPKFRWAFAHAFRVTPRFRSRALWTQCSARAARPRASRDRAVARHVRVEDDADARLRGAAPRGDAPRGDPVAPRRVPRPFGTTGVRRGGRPPSADASDARAAAARARSRVVGLAAGALFALFALAALASAHDGFRASGADAVAALGRGHRSASSASVSAAEPADGDWLLGALARRGRA